jgi:hypothetical protein
VCSNIIIHFEVAQTGTTGVQFPEGALMGFFSSSSHPGQL